MNTIDICPIAVGFLTFKLKILLYVKCEFGKHSTFRKLALHCNVRMKLVTDDRCGFKYPPVPEYLLTGKSLINAYAISIKRLHFLC